MQRYGINTISNIIASIFSLLVGIWFTPYLLGNLGIELYGLVPVALAASSYLTLLTSAITTTVGRYLSIEMSSQDLISAKTTFNSMFFFGVFASIIFLPVVFFISLLIPFIINIPEGFENDSILLFMCVLSSVILTIISTVFGLSSFVKSRFDLRNLAMVSSLFMRVILIVILFILIQPSLTFVGFGYLAQTITLLLLNVWIWKRLTPELNIGFSYFAKTKLIEVSKMAAWILVDQAGVTLFRSADIFLVNMFLGAVIGGEYGLVLQMVWLVPTIGATAATPLQPAIFEHYATKDKNLLIGSIAKGSRILALGMGVVMGMFMGFGKVFLELWVGSDYIHLFIAMAIGIYGQSLAQISQPLLTLLIADKRHAMLGISTILTGVGHVLTCIIILAFFSTDIVPIVFSMVFWLLVKTHLVAPYFVNIKGSYWILQKYSFVSVLVSVFIGAIGIGLQALSLGSSWTVLFVEVLSALGIFLIFYIVFLATPNELSFITRKVMPKIPMVKTLLNLRYQVALRRKRKQSTYTRFFRLPGQFECLVGQVLDFIKPNDREIRIAVYGCSDGAEPYSIVSYLMKERGDVKVKVYGVDIDQNQISKAMDARYPKEMVLANPLITKDFIEHTFENQGEVFSVKDVIREKVEFITGDVRDSKIRKKIGKVDIIFAQNFLVHLSRKEQVELFHDIIESLKSPGALFIDGMDLDLRERCAKAYNLIPLRDKIQEIHEQNEKKMGWPYAYWAIPPFENNQDYRYATIFLKGEKIVNK